MWLKRTQVLLCMLSTLCCQEHDEHIIQNCWPVEGLKPGPINALTPVQSDVKEKKR